MIMERQRNEKRKYELMWDKNYREEAFGEMNTYMKCIFEFLWTHPKCVANILSNSNKKDVKEYLAHFFTNNFYENILSNKNKEEQLLYIITSLLKKEINNLDINNNINNLDIVFLNETPCGYIFEELQYKKDIKSFFKIIIIDLIEELEISYHSQGIIFNPDQIKDTILLAKKEEENEKNTNNKEKKFIDFSDSKFENENEEKIKLFYQKYQFGLPKEDLENKLKEKNIKENEKMINFIDKKIIECSDNPYLYSAEVFLENINFTKTKNFMNEQYNDEERKFLSKNIFTIYKKSFIQTLNIIDKLFDNLISNIHLMPYSIKCINKILCLLISNKFPNLSTFEKNIVLSKFFFHKLFFPLFINPAVSLLINDFIISDNTLLNITTIITIINKFISGQFYKDIKEEGNFTPFNWYFLNKMPTLFEFFEKSMNVKLPGYIEKIINKEENEFEYNYEFDYFKENKDEIVYMKNICFSLDDFIILINNMKNSKEIIFPKNDNKPLKIEKALEKIIKNENKLKKVKQKIEELSSKDTPSDSINNKKNINKSKTIDNEKEKNNGLKFFMYSNIIFNKKYSDLLNYDETKEYFNIKEKKKKENSENSNNNLIKLKNFICAFLYNFQSLDKIDFDSSDENVISFLQRMKTCVKSSDLINDENIPSEWYINSIIDYLKQLPEDLSKDDYTGFFNQLEEDINNSIKLYNFEETSILVEKIKLVKKSHIYYDKAKKIMVDIDLNQIAQEILEKREIPVEIKFNYSENEKTFEIIPHTPSKNFNFHFFSINFYFNQKKRCQTIKQFTNIFPDLTEYNKLQDINVFDLMEELEIPNKLLRYFDYIGDQLRTLIVIKDEKKFEDIKIKIYDYVMEKLYDKIYPEDPQKEDILIFQNCVKYSWVEFKHLVKGKNNYISENFIPDIVKYFENIKREKSPRKKLKYVNKIFLCIFNLASLNGDKIDGTDDSLPILNYALIKARPYLIYSNCKFMNLFLGEKKNKSEGHLLSQLIGICNQVSNFSVKSVFDVTEEEFEKKSLLAIEKDV